MLAEYSTLLIQNIRISVKLTSFSIFAKLYLDINHLASEKVFSTCIGRIGGGGGGGGGGGVDGCI
jgi:hypothetical protein